VNRLLQLARQLLRFDSSSKAQSAAQMPDLIRPANLADMPAVLAIYNEAVANTTASYDYEPRILADQVAIFHDRIAGGFPFFVLVDDAHQVLGYSTYGLYRPRPGWRFAVEHSVYVDASQRGKGLGQRLMAPIIDHARRRGFHTMVAVIDAENVGSIRLHERCGFTMMGVMKQGGYKFDRWLDVAFMQLML
jgi:L-amino acid N-acyltransferase YncA